MTEEDKLRIAELVCKSLDGELSREEGAILNAAIASDAEAAAYYVRCVSIYSGLKKSPQMQYLFCLEQVEDNLKPHSLEALAEYEKIAPALTRDPVIKTAAPVIVSVDRREKTVRKINKASLLTAIASLAAMILFAVFAHYAPVRRPEAVATLIDSIDAQWADLSEPLTHGSRLTTTFGPYLLRKGAAKLFFDNQTEVFVEGPAEFQITAENRIRVNYGRLYAVVPTPALGFSVVTPNSTIIDLGTEFGVIAGFDGSTELHVFKGETALVAGQHEKKSRLLVKEGVAKQIYGDSALISDITANGGLFIQNLDSQVDFVWRGDAISLADIVGGGNGLGNGTIDGGYNPLKRKFEVFKEIATPVSGPEDYCPIYDNPMIDGIFVPNGNNGPVQVSSRGHLFEECPKTDGKFCQGTFNGAWHGGKASNIPKHPLRLEGKTYGTGQYASIYIHANQGITFDLNAIRKNVGGLTVKCFTATAGISESVLDYPRLIVRDDTGQITSPLATIYVLVDGQVRFEKTDISPEDAPLAIDIPLTENDQFLTLMATQGSDAREITHDWTMFAEPVLQIERP